jgi:hypothetical protein
MHIFITLLALKFTEAVILSNNAKEFLLSCNPCLSPWSWNNLATINNTLTCSEMLHIIPIKGVNLNNI